MQNFKEKILKLSFFSGDIDTENPSGEIKHCKKVKKN